MNTLYINRGISDKETFLHPPSPFDIDPVEVGIDETQLERATNLLKSFISSQAPILVYGDYDADGITATALMWETLHGLGANVHPFIPSREHHGYGLSIKGLEDAFKATPFPIEPSKCLIVTVDNGIVAHEPIAWLKESGATVIVTDHHQQSATLPYADAIVHSTLVCGAGVAWVLAKSIDPQLAKSTLDLVCIGTVADMMPLVGPNRSLVMYGLEALRHTKRPGLQAMFTQTGIDCQKPLGTYHVNYVIAPRLNATGRLIHAFDSLRLLCTKNTERAKLLAASISDINKDRQDLTHDLLEHAKESLGEQVQDKIIVIDNDTYHEGVIGLIAGKLVETYSRPAIVIARKEGVSKASARSISGVNITELIRSQSHLLLGVGGHPMAAGFSIQTEQIDTFREEIISYSSSCITEEMLIQKIDVDCEISGEDICDELYERIQELQPFGIGNPQPLFALKHIPCLATQQMGNMGQHLKLQLLVPGGMPLTALWFGHGDYFHQLKPNQNLDLLCTIDQNSWKGKTTLQLMIKAIA